MMMIKSLFDWLLDKWIAVAVTLVVVAILWLTVRFYGAWDGLGLILGIVLVWHVGYRLITSYWKCRTNKKVIVKK